jgi:ribosomal protein L18
MATKEKKRKKKKKEKRKRCKLADEKCFGLVLTRSERNAC